MSCGDGGLFDVALNVANRVVLGRLNRHFAAEKLTDILNVVVDHRWSLKTQTPRDHRHVLWQAHWFKHLRAEDSRVSDLDPSLQSWMIPEDL